MSDEKYPEPTCAPPVNMSEAQCCVARNPSIGERLAERKARLQHELDEIDEALQAMENDPKGALMLNKITKAIGRNL